MKPASNPDLDELQRSLSSQLDFSPANLYKPQMGDIIYTVDVAYENGKALVGIDKSLYLCPESKTISVTIDEVEGHYESGYFAFYEGEVVLRALNQSIGGSKIDLLIVDGHGLAHPRRFGLACYVGLKRGVPAIGIAKRSLLEFSKSWLSNEQYSIYQFMVDEVPAGLAIRLQEGINPVFISPGNLIDIETSVEIIKSLAGEYRLPENLRRAHLASIDQFGSSE